MFTLSRLRRKWIVSGLTSLLILILCLGFQNCSGQFNVANLESSLLSPADNTLLDTPYVDDVPMDTNTDKLYVYARSSEVLQGEEFKFAVQLNKVHNQAVTINLETVSDSALADVDFISWKGSVTIPAGSMQAHVRVGSLVPRAYDIDKQFFLKIQSVSSGELGQAQSKGILRARLQNLVGFQTIEDFSSRMCGIDSQGVVSCMGCELFMVPGQEFPTCRYNKQLKPVAGLPAVRSMTQSCYLTKDDRVLCSGYNQYGQAGMDSKTSFVTGFNEINLGGPATALVGTWDSNCALMKTGRVKCWGRNSSGFLGDGSELVNGAFSSVPIDTIVISNVTAIVSRSYGGYCALQTNGQIYCWGNLPTVGISSTPTMIYEANDIREFSAGHRDSFCVLHQNGNVECMNYDQATSTYSFVNKPEVASTRTLASGPGHICAVLNDQRVKCWGQNMFGKLGYLWIHWEPVTTPVEIPQWQGAVKVVASMYRTCALMPDSSIRCLGLSQGDSEDLERSKAIPLTVPGLTNVTAGKTNDSGSCVESSIGVKCWFNLILHQNFSVPSPLFNKIGNEFTAGLISIPATSLKNAIVTKNYSGEDGGLTNGCFVSDEGQVKCWGKNVDGNLGNGSNEGASLTAVTVQGVSNVVSLKGGYEERCALTQQKKLYCWGRLSYYKYSSSTLSVGFNVATEIPRASDVEEFYIDSTMIHVLQSDGVLKLFGAYYKGSTLEPLELRLSGVKKYFGRPGCAVMTTGSVTCTVYDDVGQISFKTIAGIHNPSTIVSMGSVICATLTSGNVVCWGDNLNGGLGDGTNATYPKDQLVTVLDISNAKELFSVDGFPCARIVDSSNTSKVMCWGSNWQGSNPSYRAFEMSSLRNTQAVVNSSGNATLFIDSYGRARTLDLIMLSAIPYTLKQLKN